MPRDNFSQSTSRILAERVGYLCSNPNCRTNTVGPNQHSEKSTRIGEAAHISAASYGGPRYDTNQTSSQRRSIENGIWLCSNCADLIDKDEKNHPTHLLKKWKVDAELEMYERIKGKKANQEPAENQDPFSEFGYTYQEIDDISPDELKNYTLSPEAAQLRDYISDISEALFFASWLIGIEHSLWRVWEIEERVETWDRRNRISKTTANTLKVLSENCGGWIFWHPKLHQTVWAPKDLWSEYWEEIISESDFLSKLDIILQNKATPATYTFGLIDGYSLSTHQLKKDLLFFDKLAVLDSILDPFEDRYNDDYTNDNFNIKEKKELLWLLREGYVQPASRASLVYAEGKIEDKMAKELKTFRDKETTNEFLFKRMVFDSVQLQRRLSAPVTPIFHDSSIVTNSKLPTDSKKTQIIKLVINNLPEPSLDTPWEKIIEFKNNEDAMGKFYGFQSLVTKLTKDGYSIKEAYQEIEWNLYQYEVQMKKHKIIRNPSTLEKIIVTTAEIAENLVRLKFGAAAKTLFEVKNTSMEYDMLDTSMAGHQLAYVYDVKKLIK